MSSNILAEKYQGNIKNLLGLYRVLINLAKRMGYRYESVSGSNGRILLFGEGLEFKLGNKFEVKVEISGTPTIEVGREQSMVDRVVTLAHEVGHAFDYYYNPPGVGELARFCFSGEKYLNSWENYEREESAWRYAKHILQWLRSYHMVSEPFEELRESCLDIYKSNCQIQEEVG